MISVLSLGVLTPEVHPQATSISQLEYPDRLLLADFESAPIRATVHYEKAKAGFSLMVGLFDPTGIMGVLHVGKASPDPCVEPSGIEYLTLAFQENVYKNLRAFCLIKVNSESGMEQVELKLDKMPALLHLLGYGPGDWDLAIGVSLFDEKSNIVEGSTSIANFSIELVVRTFLKVVVPPEVIVAVDGKGMLPGPVQMELLSGMHTISVPDSVEINNTTRLKFVKWEDGSTEVERMDFLPPFPPLSANATFEAEYVKQHYLAISSTQGNATGAGWYDEGSRAIFSVSAGPAVGGLLGMLRNQWKSEGWYEKQAMVSTSSKDSIVMDQPHSLEARWKIDNTIPFGIAGIMAMLSIAIAYMVLRRRKETRSRTGSNP